MYLELKEAFFAFSASREPKMDRVRPAMLRHSSHDPQSLPLPLHSDAESRKQRVAHGRAGERGAEGIIFVHLVHDESESTTGV